MGEYVRAPKREPEAKAANTTTSKPRQSVLPLHAGNHTLHECETELPDRKKTCRRDTAGVPERRGNTSKGTVGSCVLRQEGAEAKAASLRAASKLRRPCKITTLGRVVDIRT